MSTNLKEAPIARNGVDTPAIFATMNVLKGQPELARFQFRARNQWKSGAHSRTTINGFSGAGQEHQRDMTFAYDADHPVALNGSDNAPTPLEFLLHALLTCITAGAASIAAARGIDLDEIESSIEGDIDLLGVLGMSENVRNGYQGLKVSFRIKGNASEEDLRKIIFRSKDRSAVYDVLTNGVPIDIAVTAEGS